MAGTHLGGLKVTAANKARFGDDYYVKIGALGGAAKVKKGFAVSGKARSAGYKGGRISRPGRKITPLEREHIEFQEGFFKPAKDWLKWLHL